MTVVEWGNGVAEGLAEHRLDIEILREHGEAAGESRTLRLTGVGPRWAGLDLDTLVPA